MLGPSTGVRIVRFTAASVKTQLAGMFRLEGTHL